MMNVFYVTPVDTAYHTAAYKTRRLEDSNIEHWPSKWSNLEGILPQVLRDRMRSG